jgi:hypothetical protein
MEPKRIQPITRSFGWTNRPAPVIRARHASGSRGSGAYANSKAPRALTPMRRPRDLRCGRTSTSPQLMASLRHGCRPGRTRCAPRWNGTHAALAQGGHRPGQGVPDLRKRAIGRRQPSLKIMRCLRPGQALRRCLLPPGASPGLGELLPAGVPLPSHHPHHGEQPRYVRTSTRRSDKVSDDHQTRLRLLSIGSMDMSKDKLRPVRDHSTMVPAG